MPQATDSISFKDAHIEISDDDVTYTDISGYSNKVEIGGGERMSGEFFTADGDTPILTVGKRGSFDIGANVLYSEGAQAPYLTIKDAYENATQIYLRWAPAGNTVGNKRYTAGPGYILSPVYPAGDASSPDPIACEFTIKTLTVTTDTIT